MTEREQKLTKAIIESKNPNIYNVIQNEYWALVFDGRFLFEMFWEIKKADPDFYYEIKVLAGEDENIKNLFRFALAFRGGLVYNATEKEIKEKHEYFRQSEF